MIVEEDGKYYFANSDIERVNKIVVTKEGYKSYEQVTNFQEFEEVFESQVSLEQVNTFVLLVDPKHFNESNTEILPESKKELNEIIKQLKSSKSIDVLLISYLDEEETDLTIAKNRAKLVLQYFVDNGLDEKRFAYKGVRQNTVRVERVFRLLLEIPPIHFESNSGQLQSGEYPELEKVISIMNEHLDARIEVQGHADSRGSKSANIKVSNKRAQSIVEYLVKKGIARDRLVAKGYGESRLRNKCSDGVTCSDKEHKFNRRVEFMVIE